MNRLAVALITLVALIVAAVLLSWPPTDEALPAPEPALETATRSASAAAEAASSPSRDVGAAPREDATPAPWLADLLGGDAEPEAEAPVAGTISGRVAWRAGGLPVEGARVRLQRAPRDTVIPVPGEDVAALAADPATTATTDNHGKFKLGWVPTREILYLRIELDDGTVEIADLRARPGPDENAWQGEYLLDARGTITGTIVGPDDEPLAAVVLRAVDELRFDDPAVPWDVREARIAGAETLRRPDRRRAALLPFPTAHSDRAGRFTIPAVREGIVHLLLRHDQLVTRRVDVPIVGGRTTDVGTIRLGLGVPVTVRLVDPQLRPIAGAEVAVVPAGWRFGPPPGRSAADGTASFRLDLPGGALREDDDRREALRVRAGVRRGGAPWSELGTIALPGATFVLSPRGDFDVRLVDGESLGDRLRYGTRPRAADLRWTASGSTRRITGIPAEASVTLFAHAPGRAPALARVPSQPMLQLPLALPAEPKEGLLRALDALARWSRRDVELRLADTFAVRVHVRDVQGRAIAGARVTLSSAGQDPVRRLISDWTLGVTDAAGELVAQGLWQDRLIFSAAHPDHGRAHVRPAVTALVPGSRIELQMAAPMRVTGTILAGDQPARRRYRVRAACPDPVPDGVSWYDDAECLSDDLGRFEIPRVGPWPFGRAEWRLTVEEPAAPDAGAAFRTQRPQPPYVTKSLRFRPGDHIDLALQLEESDARRDWRGVVRIAGMPVAGAHVELWDLVPVRRGRSLEQVHTCATTTATDGQGLFAFAHAYTSESGTPAELRVFTLRHGHRLELARATFSRSQFPRSPPPLEIDVPVGDLILSLRGPDGLALAHRPARLVAETAATLLVVTDANGSVREHALPAGRWTVEVMDGSGVFRATDPPFVIPSGDTAIVTCAARGE